LIHIYKKKALIKCWTENKNAVHIYFSSWFTL